MLGLAALAISPAWAHGNMAAREERFDVSAHAVGVLPVEWHIGWVGDDVEGCNDFALREGLLEDFLRAIGFGLSLFDGSAADG